MLTRLAFVALLAAGCVPTDTAVTYCYVEAGTWGGTFNLRGSIPIGFDRDYGIFGSPDAAVEAARLLGCEVRP